MHVHLFETDKPAAKPARPPETSDAATPRRERSARFVCAACGREITRAEARYDLPGAGHHHTQVNPHGFIYTLRCWSEAPGARALGSPSSEWSWFTGYAWQIADCRGCGAHLGWRFTGEGPAFWGLVTDRLREVEGDEEPG